MKIISLTHLSLIITFIFIQYSCEDILQNFKEKDEETIESDSAQTVIVLNNEDIRLTPNEEFQLSYTIEPQNIVIDDLQWQCSDTSIVSISSNGLVKAIRPGNALITLSSEKHFITVYASIIVTPVFLQSIKINNDDSVILATVNDPLQLILNYYPENATYKSIKWETSGFENSIDQNGLLTITKPGLTWVTATGDNTGSTSTPYDNINVLPIKKDQNVTYYVYSFLNSDKKFKLALYVGCLKNSATIEKIEIFEALSIYDYGTFETGNLISSYTLNETISAGKAQKLFEKEITYEMYMKFAWAKVSKLYITSNKTDHVIILNGNLDSQTINL